MKLSSPNVFLPLATVLFLLLYLATLEPVFGVLCLASFLAYVSLDFFVTAGKKGRSTLLEIAYAVIAAAVVWLTLSTVLQTPSPLDVVTSCSMKPFLDRGDLVIVQGRETYAAPFVEYSGELPSFSVSKFNCTVNQRGIDNSQGQCTGKLILKNATSSSAVPVSRKDVQGNDVIVFESSRAGLVIHRIVLGLRDSTSGKIIYFTKGDNNQVTDQEALLDPVQPAKIHGKMLARIPLVGYLRLFLAGQFKEPRGCDTLVDVT